ncbi:MAG: error-prone DNA polymerase, partial [Hyphomonas sp.]
MTLYAELAVTTNFSFLRGASHPEELVKQAADLGLKAIGIADRNTLAGIVRAHLAAREAGLKLLVGARLVPADGPEIITYPMDRAAYGRLSRLISEGKLKAGKGDCHLEMQDILNAAEGQILIIPAPEKPSPGFGETLEQIAQAAPGRTFLAARYSYCGRNRERIGRLAALSAAAGTPLIAINDVLYHQPQRRPLQDVLTCIREHCRLDTAGFRLEANAERHLKDAGEMARLFRGFEPALARTLEIAARCRFSLDELAYEYPDEPVPSGTSPQQHLERLTWQGAKWRYPGGVPETVSQQLRKELRLISELSYAPYFLTVHDIVAWAREQGILCQGRGSAANSAVCFCLGVTSVNPAETSLLFERFLSRERKEPPDIDVDFEHERREEVIQYVYKRYGRRHAALTATVICYRPRSAVREVCKALGLSEEISGALAGSVWGSWGDGISGKQIEAAGLDPENRLIRRAIQLTRQLIGFPRHLSQHVGGFVLTRGPLTETVPIGHAAMQERTFIEWDKDDISALGILKVDILALGMLTCIRKAFDLLEQHKGQRYTLATVPPEDAATYDMLCKGDSLGVFQVESRAQMNMLPRLRPRTFYDLVIEVAIVRPGPIQGDMVHPYLRRRQKLEPVNFPSPAPEHGPADELSRILKRTLGVPLFQEQAMQISIDAAKFTPEEANGLRRAMATFRKVGTIRNYEEMMVSRMVARGYDPVFAKRCFDQVKGFGEYGFPESHAASFALLVYVSSWLKCHHPDVFSAALLNSQPMGFYAPAQIVRDACDHGVEVRPVDVNYSDWDTILEPVDRGDGYCAVRLGLRQIDGLRETDMAALMAARGPGYTSPDDLRRRTGLNRAALERLATADAFRSMGRSRREAVGTGHEVDESLMNAVTGMSGSGPGFVARFVAARTAGGVA